MGRGRVRGTAGRRGAARAATAFVVVGLMGGCSSRDSAQDEEWRHNYCSALGTWQDTRNASAADGSGVDADDGQSAQPSEPGIAGYTVIAAAKRLDREGLDRGGSHILDDTARAISGDMTAEGQAVAYCDDSGFETLMNAG
ncbi:hypothetical protein M4V62_03275 [Streptomyces durmitorensis]|uniref:Lipoprotein n=1 Tax=Streptomyces durmitorensis TaxID=319947 RepID=A0ABY4PM35_9ACTN|nr:hypothetical protein [Streptomyces durmitorensis]UQT54179.1 hypothetical protein M4V62_03275 [Streptomyces durmitorensis]